MSTILGTLSVATRALHAQEGALNTVANNIANANTPGYTREVALLTAEAPLQVGDITVGNGVSFDGARSVRDTILELRMDQETQQESRYEAYANAMDQVQSLFSDSAGSGLGTTIDKFFSRWQSLSESPTDPSLRQAVMSAGGNLASAFNLAAHQLDTIEQGLDRQVSLAAEEINSDTSRLAKLNQQIMSLRDGGKEAGAIEDQRYEVLNKLSELVDVAVTRSNDGSLTVTTSSGVPLVAGAHSYALKTATDSATGFQHIRSEVADVTSAFTGGRLAGLLEARDREIPSVRSNVDNLAASIIKAVNTQSKKGFDLKGNAGVNFFGPESSSLESNAGAAANMAMAIGDVAQVAASAGGAEGDGANALAIARIQNEALLDGATATEFYSGVVSSAGNEVARARDEQTSVNLVLTQLRNQRSGISGVSVDEEAANLIACQRAYQASAQVVAAIDRLTSNVIQTL